MTVTSTNAIRNFADRVRGLSGSSKELILTPADARNLNHEIQQLLARLVELQDQAEVGKVQIELGSNKF